MVALIVALVCGEFSTETGDYQQGRRLRPDELADTLKGSQRDLTEYTACTQVKSTVFLVSSKEKLLLTLALAA